MRPRLRWLRDRAWLLGVMATIPEEERDWFAAFLVLHAYARYGPEGAHTNRQMEKLYHRLHFGRWENGR